MASDQDILRVLETTSRTFFFPIARLPEALRQAVAAAYLCMRAIDEVEDHPELDNRHKASLLETISRIFQEQSSDELFSTETLSQAFIAYEQVLPEVTLRLAEWATHAPASIAPRIWDATAAMADRMARVAMAGWEIRSEADLDRYTFGVAGAVGVLLCDLWAWYDGTQSDRSHAVGYGRGLQAVNILRNRADDLARGVDFFPDGWTNKDLEAYARRHLRLADTYTQSLPAGPIQEACKIPLALAYGTLEALAQGKAKLTRASVLHILQQVIQDHPLPVHQQQG